MPTKPMAEYARCLALKRRVLADGIQRRAWIAGASVLVASVAAAIGMWGVSPSSSKVAVSAPNAAANELAARSDAASLLRDLSLPSGATRSAVEPAGDGSVLAHPGSGPPATPNVVEDTAWWLVPGTPPAVLAYISAHRPAGSEHVLTASGRTGTNGISVEVQVSAWPPISNVLSTRWLVIEVVQLPDGSTGLRADAQVVWVTPRPASERIPPGTHRLRVSVRSTVPINKPKQRPFTVISPKRLHRIVALLNALPASQLGVRACPNDPGVRVQLTFYARRGAAPLAVAVVNPRGCGDVQLTIGGQPQPSLEGEWLPGSGTPPKAPLIQQLDSVLGVKLNTSFSH